MSGPSLRTFFDIARQAATALAELHRSGVVHGNISPETLRVEPSGRVKLSPASGVGEVSGRAAAYRSPEQSGRIDRVVDHRTDFYSLGATFYELLTGVPPFVSDDPLELVHAHIARVPLPPSALTVAVPVQVSRIVLKLLAKDADERYQTAFGLGHDLARSAAEWAVAGTISAFELGLQDVPDRLVIPNRLYGRGGETARLTEAFNEASGGLATLLLVSGYSGSGKTALINDVYRPLARDRGYFIAGKFDQVVRNIPYGALVQAFGRLARQLLTESEDRLAAWRARLGRALGPNGGVLTEVIPELELILGKQPAPPRLDPAEAQNRFRFVFESLVGTIAQADRPLVVFLDDVQWADGATLELVHALVTAADLRHLLIVCAYRDIEVGPDHVFSRFEARAEAAGAQIRRLPLSPLRLADLNAFLGDTLRLEPRSVEPLAGIILRRTDGNPFFTIQLLRSLAQEGLLRFDPERAAWTFEIDAIARSGTTDDIVALMTSKIRRLSDLAQGVVTLAACIGSSFEWETFSTVSPLPPERAAEGLAEALETGLVLPVPAGVDAAPAYVFLHDRVQQAAYALIPEAERPPVHLNVGRLLLERSAGQVPDDRLFETVNHLNLGHHLIQDLAERLTLARLNLGAGRKAKMSTAYQAASEYLDAGISLLPASAWETDYELAYSLHLEAAEARYLAGRFQGAEQHFRILLDRVTTTADRGQVYGLGVALYENQSRWADAVASGCEGLALFGIVFPEATAEIQAALDREVTATEQLLGERSIASLLDLPVMADPAMRVAMRTLTVLWAPAYISGNQPLAALISVTLVRLSLEHGQTEDSAYGYVTHAITVGPVRRDYAAAYEWGRLALSVNDRFGDLKRRAKIHQQFQAHVNLWRRPFETCIPHAREARRSGLQAGDFAYAGYGAATESWSAWLINRDLDRFVREFTPTLAFLEKVQMADFRATLALMLNWARALQGRTAGPLSLSDAAFDERQFFATYERTAPFFLTFYYTAKLHLSLLHEDFAAAVQAAEEAKRVAVTGTIWPVLIDAWGGLAAAAICRSPTEDDPAWRELDRSVAVLSALEPHCPENFRCFWLLLSAERQRLLGRHAEAAALGEEAIAYARQTESLQNEALANQVCGRLWLGAGREALASAFLNDAHRCYTAWGAVSQAAHLERRHGRFIAQQPVAVTACAGAQTAAHPPSTSLDMSTVIKVAHAIASEIELEGLQRQLMRLALENAGAQRGLFLLHREGQLNVEALASADAAGVVTGGQIPSDQIEAFASSVVRYVQRTGEGLVIGDASLDERFSGDPYIQRAGVKSILCVPVGHQGRQGALLYLENNLTAQVFTPARTEMMRILAAQAAISLENARLYGEMRSEIERRTQAEAALRDALGELERLKNRLETENVYLQEEIRTQHNFNEIVGNSPSLLDALHKVERVAPTESTVLIVGETGTGKELFARAVHSRSRRNDRPLVKVNCGAIAPGLVESELFGHVKGAFTGAIEKRVGRFEVAHGGTIFLDEIGELPLEAQVKLLRVLQEQEFEPVGSSRTVCVSVRVIAATNRNLDEAVREGRFRADLLYRLNVFPITVPPLRQRRSDVAPLAGFFVLGLVRRLGKPLQGFNARSMERLMAYSWPGNVRELQNVTERAAILARGQVLELEDTALIDAPPRGGEAAAGRSAGTLEDVQRVAILEALKTTGGVVEGVRGAATLLGLHPNTLRSRMKKLGITPGAGAS